MIKHIKTHIVGYLALFLVLGGGTAYANHLQVFSSDIVDGQVFGVDVTESTLSVPDMGCQTGKIRGYARVRASSSVPWNYQTGTSYIDRTNNCSNGPVQVRRQSTGLYCVRFLGNSSTLATVVSNSDNEGENGNGNDNIVSVGRIFDGADAGAFRVEVEDVGGSNGSDATDGWFTIALI
jgi:hypothetical protein